jgi:hypothetical protein
MLYKTNVKLLQAGLWLRLFFGLDDKGDMFFRNVGWLSTDYTASCLRRIGSRPLEGMQGWLCTPYLEYQHDTDTAINYRTASGSKSKLFFFSFSVALVRERTIPTERPPLVGEVSGNFCGYRGCRMVSAADPLRP